jgi:ABC-2 type transport system permease protein
MIRALLAIARRDARVALSYRATFVTRPVGVAFTLALFYYVSRLLGDSERFSGPDDYFAFVAVGIVIQNLIRSTLTMPLEVRQELVAGSWERLELSAAGGTAALMGMLIFPFVYAMALATFTLVLAATVFGLEVQWATAPLAVPLGLLGALAFAPFALVFSAAALAFKQAPGQGAALAVVSLVSGVYFPVELLPSWLEWVSRVQPFTPAVELMRHVLVDYPIGGSAAVELARLVAFAVIGLPLGAWAVVAARRYSRRRGTLLEY